MSEPIVVSRHVPVPPSVVYAYLTESDKWSMWQGESASLDPRPGGGFSMAMPDGATAQGTYVELVPDRKVVFTWGWVGNGAIPPGSSTVEVELVEVSDGTVVTLTHRDLPDPETPPHRAGWEHHLDALTRVARSY